MTVSLKLSETGDGWRPSMCLLQHSAEMQLLLSHISYGKFLSSNYFSFVLTLFFRRTYAQISEAVTDCQVGEYRKHYMFLYQNQIKLCSWEFLQHLMKMCRGKLLAEGLFACLCLKHLTLGGPKQWKKKKKKADDFASCISK